ncbi:4-hydroxy-tetrahydrodipicolinate reductase [Myroides odoratimimus]|uniref:4-hydroxy-tetrahydrodipicolinate reductase n=1 Tax=Myroides TaxID=76831 RepID=UPI0002460B31|nr:MULTISPECIES: 4-hydroxy-tetrahydrodipicolinate reductase [Myroides]AJA69144.1 dihydrodipicolinate reductase [Myroides sp. A21]EHO13338.1 dihydrodipicolinate reductase [Myroides odoratimimus CCUG 12901]MCA4791977.1 4-hydroxy-tetrahydrodipicolinate reductase [Myroides odoratimimus]MCA4805819.1 4-hydroxy-tetrahydrodipicolinate reductase [Myroides odoratimimus]MCA4819360.1 4-hydroxy-tetrahydrodipicolinate reductase [Myroides odoratimimus]
MKIALLGYGKMGQIIERIAIERGHEIVLRKRSSDTYEGLKEADVAIDFSVPSAAVQNITTCFELNIPIISGTTGWLEEYDKMVDLCTKSNGAFLYGSNFSLGVNLFFELNSYLAKMMNNLNDYKVSMEEIHHTQKLDAPSGTAISLANGIIENTDYTAWTLDTPDTNQIHIDAKRIDSVPGTHSVFYDSAIDQIEIKHTAHNREGFALGAVVAAEWIQNKKGIFSMKDVLNLKK